MLSKLKVKQTYQTYLQFEKAISKLSYNGLLDLLSCKEVDPFSDKVCELLEVYAVIKQIKKERNKHNKLEAV